MVVAWLCPAWVACGSYVIWFIGKQATHKCSGKLLVGTTKEKLVNECAIEV